MKSPLKCHHLTYFCLSFVQILSISLIPKHENDGFKTTKENFGENEKLFDSFINFVFGG